MKKQMTLRVDFVNRLKGGLLHIGLTPEGDERLPEMLPGQFVEVAVDKAHVLLNRPFSIFNCTDRLLELLVKPLGRASEALGSYEPGDSIRVIAPLGHGFTLAPEGSRVLLIGGGVGIAPLLYLARTLNGRGIRPVIIYGERTVPDAALCARLSEVADLQVCTDDGSAGFHGFVTQHPALTEGSYDLLQVCGPAVMMKNVARIARGKGLDAEYSLENKMACGLGACLCCVENTTTGNRCVCTDGPVFKADELPW